MQTWAKRGLQTALVTGGLLMLGTGIASAQEDVNPDKPASPLDGSLSIPLQIKDNAIGTPLGQVDLPDVEEEINSDDITSKVPEPVAGTADKMANEVSKAAKPVTDTISGVTAPDAPKAKQDEPKADGLNGLTHGNVLHNHGTVPVQIAGNAVGLGGPAEVSTDAKQNVDRPAPVNTSADGSPLGGNVAGVTGALPVQLANNAVGFGADVESRGQATQSAKIGGPVNTNGADGSLAGNVLKGQFANPVQVTGNALGGGGEAAVESEAKSSATADGAIKTSGKGSQLSGNVGALPVAYPLGLNGNALSGIGEASSAAKAGAQARAGATNDDSLGNPFYTLTDGNPGQLSGNIAQPELAGPAMINGVAGSLAGTSTAAGETDNHVRAGGGAGTNGRGGQLSGNIANSPVAYPLQVFGDAASLGGTATSAHENKVDSKAGNSNVAYGDDSSLSGNDVVPTLAGSGDLFGSGLSLLGTAEGTGKNKTKANSGGYVGTTGNNSQGSGNIVHPPLALPVQVFGIGGSAGGSALGNAENDKQIGSGGPPNSNDDAGVVSSNVLHTPGSVPVELFGSSGSLLANATGIGESELKSRAGGDATGTGIGGTIAGNVAQAALSNPIQGFGDAIGVAGQSDALGKNVTASNAGGDSTSDGSDGSLAGNAVALPVGGASQLFGSNAGIIGNLTGVADNDTTSTAGGDVNTTGEGGSLAGNVLAGQLLPVLQAFGSGAVVGANGSAAASNNTAAGSGGDITTTGADGALSGNLLDFPVAGVGQLFGDALAIGGNQESAAENNLVGVVGGTDETAGDESSGSGMLSQNPIGIVGQFYNVPFEVLGNALTSATNATEVTVANEPAEFEFPVDGAGLPIDQLPELPSLPGLPGGDGGGLPQLPGLPGGGDLPSLPGLPGGDGGGLPQLPGLPGGGDLPSLPGLPGGDGGGLPQLPGLPGGGDLPGLPGGGDLPELPNLPQVPGVPGQSGGGANAVHSAEPIPAERISAPANPISGVLPGFGDLVKLPGLGGGGLPKLPGLDGGLPKLPGMGGELPVQGLPGLDGNLPKLPGAGGGELPKVPGVGDLPGLGGELPEVPGVSQLPGFGGGELPEIPGVPQVPGVPDVPKLPGVGGGNLPGLPGVGGGELPKVPGVGDLPGLGGNLPEVPGLPEIPEVPQVPGVPDVPNLPGVPGLDGKQQDGDLPALSVLDSGDLTGALGDLGKLAPKSI